MLIPNWVTALRSTSANFTSRRTSCAPTGPNVSTFTTVFEYASAIMAARLETSSVETCPERTMAERDGETLICSSGNIRFSSSATALTSTSTRRSKLRERSSSSQINSETSPAARPCTRICVGVTTSASAMAGSVTETRFSRSVVLISNDLPTMTRRGADPAGGVCETAAADAGDETSCDGAAV